MTIFQKGGSTHVPPTLLVIRVVLLHTLYGVSNPLIPQLYIACKVIDVPCSGYLQKILDKNEIVCRVG